MSLVSSWLSCCTRNPGERSRRKDAQVIENADLSALRDALAAREQAPTDAPVRVHNRLMRAVLKQCELLAQTPSGRALLVDAATIDPDPALRLMAAVTVQRWDTATARTTLEDLVRRAGGTLVRPMTMTAALAVGWGNGRDAALCLLNLDHPRLPATTATVEVGQGPVPSDLLDAAEQVYNLAMNGGIDHAYELAGEQFPAAAEACDAIGAVAEASVLREMLLLVGSTHTTRSAREAALASLNDEQEDALQALNARFCAGNDLMDRLEAATEV